MSKNQRTNYADQSNSKGVKPVMNKLDIVKVVYSFDDFNVFRFPDEEYEAFRQIVLFGSKKYKASLASVGVFHQREKTLRFSGE